MTETNPLGAMCPACLADPGQPCHSTCSDEPRAQPHRLRGLAASKRLRPCSGCNGIGWEPDDQKLGALRKAENVPAELRRAHGFATVLAKHERQVRAAIVDELEHHIGKHGPVAGVGLELAVRIIRGDDL